MSGAQSRETRIARFRFNLNGVEARDFNKKLELFWRDGLKSVGALACDEAASARTPAWLGAGSRFWRAWGAFFAGLAPLGRTGTNARRRLDGTRRFGERIRARGGASTKHLGV